ncbi:hypothetical protein Tco_1246630 [Tanacetum coccineum]
MHHSKQQNCHFLLVMLRLELHIASVLVVDKPHLWFLSPAILLVVWVNSVKGTTMKSLTIKVSVQEKLHDRNSRNHPLGELGHSTSLLVNLRVDTRNLEVGQISHSILGLYGNDSLQITSSGWPFVSTVLGQMAHLVASITLNSASWSDCIRPEGFLSSVSVVVGDYMVAVVGVSVTEVLCYTDTNFASGYVKGFVLPEPTETLSATSFLMAA